MEPNHYNFIKNLGYEPVGLGDKDFSSDWYTDKLGINISKKNKNYGEYTYHYWLWKNYLDKISDDWIGFCQYRKFWSLENYKNEDITFNSLKSQVINKIPQSLEKYESILGEPIFINQFRTMKFLKKGFKFFLKRPSAIIDKKKKKY